MEPFRLRMKIGAHEFEAEGDQGVVERQFAQWRELIAAAPIPTASSPPPPPPAVVQDDPPAGTTNSGTAGVAVDRSGFEKIIRQDGKRLSLSVLPEGENREADAALVLMVAHKVYNGLDQVGGGALLEGLHQSGYPVARVDRVMDRHIPELVLRSGIRRAVKYRLNNRGLNTAMRLARELMDMVP